LNIVTIFREFGSVSLLEDAIPAFRHPIICYGWLLTGELEHSCGKLFFPEISENGVCFEIDWKGITEHTGVGHVESSICLLVQSSIRGPFFVFFGATSSIFAYLPTNTNPGPRLTQTLLLIPVALLYHIMLC
jgi:hypothetical protein